MDPLFIFFDLKFSAMENGGSEMTDLGAACSHGEFHKWILPKKRIKYRDDGNAIRDKFDKTDGKRKLFKRNGGFLPTVNLQEALNNFCNWIQEMKRKEITESAYLVDYNTNDKNYDILKKIMEECNVLDIFLTSLNIKDESAWSNVKHVVSRNLDLRYKMNLESAFKKFFPRQSFNSPNALERSKASMKIYEALQSANKFTNSDTIDDVTKTKDNSTFLDLEVLQAKSYESIIDHIISKSVDLAENGEQQKMVRKKTKKYPKRFTISIKPKENDKNQLDIAKKPLLIFYDLEFSCKEITQLGAICKNFSPHNQFNRWILPEKKIDGRVAKHVTGVKDKIDTSDGQRKLFNIKQQIFLPTVSLQQGLTDFCLWIQEMKKNTVLQSVCLINYGGSDYKILERSMNYCNISKIFKSSVNARDYPPSVDMIKLVRKLTVKARQPGLQGTFAHHFPGEEFEHHDALEDAKASMKIFEALKSKKKISNIDALDLITNRMDQSRIVKVEILPPQYYNSKKIIDDVIRRSVDLAEHGVGWIEKNLEQHQKSQKEPTTTKKNIAIASNSDLKEKKGGSQIENKQKHPKKSPKKRRKVKAQTHKEANQ